MPKDECTNTVMSLNLLALMDTIVLYLKHILTSCPACML